MTWDLNSRLREMEAKERQLWEQGMQRREVNMERKISSVHFICEKILGRSPAGGNGNGESV